MRFVTKPPIRESNPAGDPPRFSRAELNVLVGRWIPLLLALIGFCVFVLRTNIPFVIGAGAATVLTIIVTYILVFETREIRLLWIVSTGLSLGYSVGTFNTAVGLFKTGSNVAEYFGKPQEMYSVALAIAIWITATLYFVGVFEKPLQVPFASLRSFDMVYIFIALLLVISAVASGDLGYMGVSNNAEHHVSALGEMGGMLGSILPGMTVFLRKKSKLLRNNVFFWGLIVVEMLLLVPQGRRVIIYAIAIAVLAFTLQGSSWRVPLYKKALLLIVGVTTLYFANIFFYAMRHAKQQNKATKDLSLYETTSRAFEFLSSGKNEDFSARVSDNLRDRTFVLDYFAEMLDASWTHSPLYGKDALFCLEIALPSALYPNKDKILDIGMEENLTNPQFGLFPVDSANSILTTGIADFGLVGAFAYPLLLALMLNLFCRFISLKAPAVLQALAILCVVYPMFQVEIAGAGCLVRARDLLVLMAVLLPVDFVLAPHKRKRYSPTARPALVSH